jgi:hypothetical protein
MSKRMETIAWLIAFAISWGVGLADTNWLRSIGSLQTNIFQKYPLLSEATITLPALLVGLMFVLYNRVDMVYFTLNRWRLRFGALIRVELQVEFHLAEPSDLKRVRDLFQKQFPGDKRKGWSDTDGNPLLTLPNMVLRLRQNFSHQHDNLEEPFVILSLESTQTEMPFRTWEHILSSLSSFFHELEEALKPDFKKYTCKVLFPGTNPYFGLFLRKARIPDRARFTYFTVEFTENVGGIDEVVHIGKSDVSIVAEQIAGWQHLANRYIALSNPPDLGMATE